MPDLTDFTNHSGGAVGSDSQWDIIGKEFGMTNNYHYFVEGFKTPRGNTMITLEEAKQSDPFLMVVNKALKRKFPSSNEYVNNLLRRNHWQVKNAEAIFGIGIIEENEVKGGTMWAVFMAVIMNKPVYVFDQVQGKWFQWIVGWFVETKMPILTKNFAGVGTRNINEFGIQAIKDIYIKTYNHVQG